MREPFLSETLNAIQTASFVPAVTNGSRHLRVHWIDHAGHRHQIVLSCGKAPKSPRFERNVRAQLKRKTEWGSAVSFIITWSKSSAPYTDRYGSCGDHQSPARRHVRADGLPGGKSIRLEKHRYYSGVRLRRDDYR
jgi:hypothetical protein